PPTRPAICRAVPVHPECRRTGSSASLRRGVLRLCHYFDLKSTLPQLGKHLHGHIPHGILVRPDVDALALPETLFDRLVQVENIYRLFRTTYHKVDEAVFCQVNDG